MHSYEHKSMAYAEARHWNPDYVVNMVDRFVRVARVRSCFRTERKHHSRIKYRGTN